MTTRLNPLADRITGQSFGLTNYDYLEADVNYLIGFATVASQTPMPITTETTLVTGTNTIDSLSDALGATAGQRITLLFQSALTVRNNGGGVGNIRTLTGADRRVRPNEIVSFIFDGMNWIEERPDRAAYRKGTSTAATNTLTETDLLGGAFSLPPNVLGISGGVRIKLSGDAVFNPGASTAPPRFKIKLGSGPTTVIDTGAGPATAIANSASRFSWDAEIEIFSQNATNAQWIKFAARLGCAGGTAGAAAFATGEGVVNGTLGGSTGSLIQMLGGNAAAIDSTVIQALQLTCTNPSNTSYETKLLAALMEVI